MKLCKIESWRKKQVKYSSSSKCRDLNDYMIAREDSKTFKQVPKVKQVPFGSEEKVKGLGYVNGRLLNSNFSGLPDVEGGV